MNNNETFLERNKIELALIGTLILIVGVWALNYVSSQPAREKAATEQKYRESLQEKYPGVDSRIGKTQGIQGYQYLFTLILLGISGYLIFKNPTLATIIFSCGFSSLIISLLFDSPGISPTSRDGNGLLGVMRMFGIVGMIGGGIFFFIEQKKKNKSEAFAGGNNFRAPQTETHRCTQCNLVNPPGNVTCARCRNSFL